MNTTDFNENELPLDDYLRLLREYTKIYLNFVLSTLGAFKLLIQEDKNDYVKIDNIHIDSIYDDAEMKIKKIMSMVEALENFNKK